jgi:hypothetical protein
MIGPPDASATGRDRGASEPILTDEQAANRRRAHSARPARGRGCRRVRGCSGRIEYNTVRPHSALGYLTPTDYAKVWTTNHPALS